MKIKSRVKECLGSEINYTSVSKELGIRYATLYDFINREYLDMTRFYLIVMIAQKYNLKIEDLYIIENS